MASPAYEFLFKVIIVGPAGWHFEISLHRVSVRENSHQLFSRWQILLDSPVHGEEI